MTEINTELQDLIANAVELEDQSDRSGSSDYEYVPPAAGITVARLIEYVELGVQPQGQFQGKEKEPAESVRLVFELLNPKKNIREIEVDGKTVKIADRITLTLKKSMHPKAKYAKLFDKMKYGRDSITHMAQMLNDPFILTVTHRVVENEGTKRTYVNITNEAGEYTIQAPFKLDPLTEEKTNIPVQKAVSPLKLFLFKKPTKGTWDALFIDGEREEKGPDGQTKTISRNRIQNKIKEALNFEGSEVQKLLSGSTELPDSFEEEAPKGKKSAATAVKKASTTPQPEDTSDAAPTASPSESGADALDDLLGLTD